jgi:hypothetical protein
MTLSRIENMERNLTNTLRQLEDEFANLVAAELMEHRLHACYLIDSVSAGTSVSATCGGCAGSDFCWIYQWPLSSRWAGPGPAIFVNVDGENEASPDIQSLASVVAHEVAHLVSEGTLIPSLSPPQRLEVIQQVHFEHIAAEVTPEGSAYRESHDSRFVRLAVHAAWRMHRNGGWQINPHLLLSGIAVDPWLCVDALADECEALCEMPLSKLAKTSVPNALAALFPAWSAAATTSSPTPPSTAAVELDRQHREFLHNAESEENRDGLRQHLERMQEASRNREANKAQGGASGESTQLRGVPTR